METTDVVLVIGLVVAVIILVSLTFREDHQAVLTQRMAAGSGLVLTADQIPLVQDKLGLRQRGALVGTALGAVAGWVLTSVEVDGASSPRILLVVGAAATGAAVGTACVALLAATRRPAGSVLVARSTSVSLADYSPRPARYLARLLVASSVALSTVLFVVRGANEVPLAAIILCATALATLAVFEVVGRRIAAKGQPVGSVIELVLSDAVRATYLRDLVVAPAILATYSLFIAIDAMSKWFGFELRPGVALGIYVVCIVGLLVAAAVSRTRKAVPHYLRRLWPEIAASGPGSTAIIDEPTR